ncbi:MAG: LysR family transcriptional regulator [Streptosporangiaceae bacterium]
MDLDAVRTFVAVAHTGQFQAAGDELAITQQAVSKRIATLERDLGARLFVRSPKGVHLSVDGQAFLPHARKLLRVENRAVASVLPARRALRVDVLNRRTAPAVLLQAFHQQHPETDLDVVTLPVLSGSDDALAAVASGSSISPSARSPRPRAGPRLGFARSPPCMTGTSSSSALGTSSPTTVSSPWPSWSITASGCSPCRPPASRAPTTANWPPPSA